MIKTIDKPLLMKFCATDNEILHSPFSAGAYTYATDGMILIRVPRMPEFAENPKAPDPEKLAIGNLKKWYPVKDVRMPKSVDCRVCEGQGRNFVCPECSGDGTVWLSNNYSKYLGIYCNYCGGTGKVAFCEDCNGTGKVTQQKPVDFHGVIFGQRYLALLSKLPNCEIGLISKTATTPFRFDGGSGIIMPMRYDG